ATNLSSEFMANRPANVRLVSESSPRVLQWAFAAVLPLLLLLLALLPLSLSHRRDPQPKAQLSADALLDQVDEQVSVSVPNSMESLTHLVSTGSDSGARSTARRSGEFVQTN